MAVAIHAVGAMKRKKLTRRPEEVGDQARGAHRQAGQRADHAADGKADQDALEADQDVGLQAAFLDQLMARAAVLAGPGRARAN